MNKFFAVITLLGAAVFGANAQILWKITGNGTKEASYLFGTHHLAPVTMLDSVSGLNAAMAAADAVAGEIVMTDSEKLAPTLAGYMLAPADSVLTAVLTPAQLDSVGRAFSQYVGAEIDVTQMFGPLKPATVATQLAMIESMSTLAPEAAAAFSAGQQFDTEVQNRAAAAGKDIIGLETVEQQMEILMGAPISSQAEMLMEAVGQSLSGKSRSDAVKLTEAYMAQNIDEIGNLIFDEEAMESGDVERLILQRNADWVKTIAGILPSKSLFIAVGAGHLPGERGLIELLRGQGFTVEPVK